MSARLVFKAAPPRPELDALLEKAKGYVMSPDEREAQQRSWVIGEMMLEHPEMTREHVENIYDEVHPTSRNKSKDT